MGLFTFYIRSNIRLITATFIVLAFVLMAFLISANQQRLSAQELPTNHLANHSFENTGTDWLLPWSFNVTSPAVATIAQDGTNPQVGLSSARIGIAGTSTSPSHVQLKQANLPMTQNVPVTVSFWAKSLNFRSINVVVQKEDTPFTEFANQHFIGVGPTWQQYSFTFTAPSNETNALLAFNLATAPGQVWIDEVSYETVATTPTPTPTPTPDTVAPELTITSPPNNAKVKRNSTVGIQVTATDNVGITKVEFYINNVLRSTDTTAPYRYNWPVPSKNAVQYTITVKAYDAAANITTKSIQVTSANNNSF